MTDRIPVRCSRRLVVTGLLSAAAGPARAQGKPPIEVVHWWTSGGESAAIRTIRRALEADGFVWQDKAVEGPDAAKTAAITRVLGGQPPTVMLWFVGQDLPSLYRDGLIRDLQDVASAEKWDSVLPPALAARMKVDGRYVVAPADLHCANLGFGNRSVLERAGVDMPNTWTDVLAAAPKLRAAGFTPIAFGGQPWQELSVFVMVMTGVGGASLHRRFLAEHDPDAAGGPEMTEVFRVFGALRPLVDKASPNRSWSDTARLLTSGQAGLYFSGDWARGDLNKSGLQPETGYLCRAAPGNEGIFSAVVDAFVMPRTSNPAVSATQDEFARVTMRPQVQHDFNLEKGAIPPRTDVSLTGYDDYAKVSARLYREGGTVLPSSSMAMTTAMRQAMYDVVHRFWNTPDADPKAAAAELRSAIERSRE